MKNLKDEIKELLQEPELPDEEFRLKVKQALGAPPSPLSYEKFLEWKDEDTLAEWVDGEIVMTSPASKRDQEVSGFLYELLKIYVRNRDLGEIIQAPFQMKLENSGREPDLMFVAKKHLNRLESNFLDGPADLVIEIISPESIGRDRGEKFYEYERAQIPEYWLIDPETKRAEFYAFNKEKIYTLVLGGSEGEFNSNILPDFWLDVSWLWQQPLPSPLQTIAEITGIDLSFVEKFEQALRKK